jgi:hypothetical protein
MIRKRGDALIHDIHDVNGSRFPIAIRGGEIRDRKTSGAQAHTCPRGKNSFFTIKNKAEDR